MASCVDDCLYYKVCSDFRGNICERDLYRFLGYRITSDELCEHFKNKADVVEVKRGEWELHPDGSGTCSCCNRTQKSVWDYDNAQNFCGHCGADMRGDSQ